MKTIKTLSITLIIAIAGLWLAALFKLNFVAHEYAKASDEELTWSKEYLLEAIEPIPDEFEWHEFVTKAGVTLRSGLLENPQATATVLVIPGFTTPIELLSRSIISMHAAGYRVAALEYRGQGMSYRPLPHFPEKGYVESYELLGDELAQFANHVKGDMPLFLLAISKGGHIAMRMAAEQQVDVDAFALIVPMIQVNDGNVSHKAMNAIARLMVSIGLGESYVPGAKQWLPDELTSDEPSSCNTNSKTAKSRSALFALNEKLRVQGVTYQWVKETTESSEKLLSPEFVSAITQPVKIYTAGIDFLVSTEKAEQFCDSLQNCTKKNFPDSYHCIPNENPEIYREILQDAVSFFEMSVKEK